MNFQSSFRVNTSFSVLLGVQASSPWGSSLSFQTSCLHPCFPPYGHPFLFKPHQSSWHPHNYLILTYLLIGLPASILSSSSLIHTEPLCCDHSSHNSPSLKSPSMLQTQWPLCSSNLLTSFYYALCRCHDYLCLENYPLSFPNLSGHGWLSLIILVSV